MSDPRTVGFGLAAVTMLFGIALIYSGWIVVQELEAQVIDSAASALPERPDPHDRFPTIAERCGDRCPPRGHRAAASGLLKVARTSARPLEIYAKAATHARRALAQEPLSADGWALLAATQAGPEDQWTSEVGADLERSYSAAPRSRTASAWRILFCARHWTALDVDLRRRALTEFVWLAAIDRPLAERLLAKMHDPAASLAFGLSLE